MQELQAGLVCLLDENGQVIVSTGDEALEDSVAAAIDQGEGFLSIGGAQYTVSVAKSALNGWCYLSIQPQHAVVPRLRFTRNVSLGVFALVLAIGIAAAYLLSRRNYRPLQHLLDALRRQSGLLREQADSDENEFHFIERSVQDLSASMGWYAICSRTRCPAFRRECCCNFCATPSPTTKATPGRWPIWESCCRTSGSPWR